MRVLLVLIAATLAGCSGPAETGRPSVPVTTPATFGTGGALTVEAGDLGQPGTPCATDGGYVDIRAGATVTVRDAQGATVALGALDAGIYSDASEGLAESLICIFGFTIEGIPDGGQFYSVEVSHRGAVNFTRAQFDEGLQLRLG